MVREKNARIGRNPKTGVETTISPRKVLVFGPAKSLKNRINGTWDGQMEDESVDHNSDD